LELFQEAPELLGPDVREQLQEALSVNAVINKLLAGLVPVRGRATDYVTIRTSDQEWVVHRTVLRQLGDDIAAQARALDVVAVAEASLFWKDIRRVLFSGSRYLVLCRISRDGLHDDWTPVKLADVVRGFAPAVAEQISTAGQGLLTAATCGTASGSQVDDPHTRMGVALQAYGRMLAARYGQDLVSRAVQLPSCYQRSPRVFGIRGAPYSEPHKPRARCHRFVTRCFRSRAAGARSAVLSSHVNDLDGLRRGHDRALFRAG
jgi:hypothetical protein